MIVRFNDEMTYPSEFLECIDQYRPTSLTYIPRRDDWGFLRFDPSTGQWWVLMPMNSWGHYNYFPLYSLNTVDIRLNMETNFVRLIYP